MDTAIARPELLLVADAVAREKNIDREEVLEAMEQAIQKAGRAKYGHEKDIRATIDRKTGDVRLSRWTEIVETVENEETQMSKPIAAKLFPEKSVGEFIVDPLPPIDFGRIAAQTAKQVIVQRVREYERKKQYDEFKDRVGEIINGVVKRTEYGNLMVELGKAEALLRRDELIARESFRNGDRVRAYIYDVREDPRGPQIFLSRTHPGFLAQLFAQEALLHPRYGEAADGHQRRAHRRDRGCVKGGAHPAGPEDPGVDRMADEAIGARIHDAMIRLDLHRPRPQSAKVQTRPPAEDKTQPGQADQGRESRFRPDQERTKRGGERWNRILQIRPGLRRRNGHGRAEPQEHPLQRKDVSLLANRRWR